MTVSTDESAVDPAELQQQLDEKDQLVLALTERLEEAAEQLDRVQRSGADKGKRVSGGGPSSDVIAQQQALIEKLGKTAELWEDVQPGEAFARIESRLDDLRGLLVGAAPGQATVAPAAPRSPSSSSSSASESKKPAQSGGDDSQEGSTLSAWEKMKAELMGEEASTTPAPSSPPEPTATVATEATTPDVSAPTSPPAGDGQDQPTLEPLSELQLPEPIDPDSADRSELAAGIEARDQYIGYLTRRLRSVESRTHQPIDWERLNNAPDDLRETLQQLEADLVDRLRIAEVDLSLERARLSRVETRVRGMQKQIEKRMNSVAGKGPSKQSDSADVSDAGKKSKGWFGGRGR